MVPHVLHGDDLGEAKIQGSVVDKVLILRGRSWSGGSVTQLSLSMATWPHSKLKYKPVGSTIEIISTVRPSPQCVESPISWIF